MRCLFISIGVFAAYMAVVMFFARLLSWKWRPDKGRPVGHDPDTCLECRYGDERDEWFQ